MSESYCFLQALVPLSNKDTSQLDNEALERVLDHFSGSRHPDDANKALPSTVQLCLPWLVSLRQIALNTEYEPFTDHTDYKALLNAAATGDLQSFITANANIKVRNIPNLIQPAACLAAQNEHVEILRHCLVEANAQYDDHLNQACRLGAKTAPMLELLCSKNWLFMNDTPECARKAIEFKGRDSFAGQWIHEHVVLRDFYQGSTEYMEPRPEDNVPNRRMFTSGDEYMQTLTDEQQDKLSGADVWTGVELDRNFGDIMW